MCLFLRYFLLVAVFSCFYCISHAQPADSAAVAKQVDSLVQVSRDLTGKREFERALEMNGIAEKVALERFGRESAVYGGCCHNHARTLSLMGNSPESEKWYLEALTIREKTLGKEHPLYALTLTNLALQYSKLKNYDKAESLYLEAKRIREKVLGKEHPDYATSLNNLAILYMDTNEYEKAESFFREALNIREKTLEKEHAEYANSLYNLANLYFKMASYEKAEPLYLQAKIIRGKIVGKEHPDYAWVLNNLAAMYKDMGNYEKAELLFLEVMAIRRKIFGNEHPNYASSLYNLGNIYMEMGNYEKAESFHLEAKVIREKKVGKEHADYASSLNSLANLYREIGNYGKAEPLYMEAQIINEKTLGKEHQIYGIVIGNLANLYTDIGNYSNAELLYLEALSINEKIFGKNHPRYGITLNDLGSLYADIGNYEKAELFYTEANNIWEKTLGREHPFYASSLSNLATLYSKIKNYQKAESLFNDLFIVNQKLATNSFFHLSDRELSNYLSKFSKSQDQSLSFSQLTGSKKVTATCYDNTLFYKGFLLTASNLIKQLALSDSVTTEKFNLLKSYQRRLAAELAKPIAERKNAEELEEKANDLEKDLARSVAGYGEAMRQVKWQEVQAALKPGEAAIEFVHYQYYGKKETDSVMYAALVLRPDDEQPLYIPLSEARQLQSHLEAQRLMSLNNLYAYLGESKPSLYGLLWAPLEPLLKGVKTIYYSPSGELNRLNLAAISGPSGEVLGDRYHLQLLMSTRQLVSPAPFITPEGGKAIVFGGIQYDADSTAIHAANDRLGFLAKDTTGGYLSYRDRSRGEFEGAWEYLGATKEESLDISKTLAEVGITTTLLQGVEATEEAFKQIGTSGPSPKILHLATHGYFFPDPENRNEGRRMRNDEPVFKMSEHPLIRSGLILAGANHAWRTGHPFAGSEDGILTAYEVSQMNLSNTELVVLSACETGLGDIKGNEGVYGLQRAFRIAGAKYLLMSLWKVPDGPTSELMTSFYRFWLKDKMPLEDAFRRAQSELKAQYEDPEMWAGFVLIKG